MSGPMYEAGAHLSLKDDVSAGLAKIASQLLGLHGQFGSLQSKIKELSSGGLKIAAGVGMLELISHTVKANAELQKQVNIFKLAGNSAEDVAAAMRKVYSSAVDVRGVGAVEQMKLYRELAGALQDNPGALGVLPDFARGKAVMSFATGRDNEEDTKRLAKMIELRGGAINRDTDKIDPQLFRGELNAAVKAIVAGQGLITTNDLQQMIKQGGPSLKNFMGNPEAFWRDYLAMAEDMGGSRSGTAVTAIARQILGGIMTPAVKAEWQKLGLLNEEGRGWKYTKKGDIDIFDPKAAIRPYEAFLHGGVKEVVDNYLRPAFQQHGFTTPQAQNGEMYRFGSTETARRAYSLYLSNDPQIKAVGERYDKTMGVEGFDKIVNQDFTHNLESVGTAFHTLASALGDAAGVAPVMGSIADGINRLGKIASEHPEWAKDLTWGGGMAATGLIGVGTYKVGSALMSGFGLPAAATQLSGAAAALDAAAIKLGGGSAISAAAAVPAAMGTGAAMLAAAGIFASPVIATGLAAGRQNPEDVVRMRQELAELIKKQTQVDSRIGGMGPDDDKSALVAKSGQIGSRIRELQEQLARAGQEAGKAAGDGAVTGFRAVPFFAAGQAAAQQILNGFKAGAGAGIGSAVPPAKTGEQHSSIHLHLDGRQVAKVVTKHQTKTALYPGAIGGMDTYGTYAPAGMTQMPT